MNYSNFDTNGYTSYEDMEASANPVLLQSAYASLMRKVYLWMTFALAVTGFTAYYVSGEVEWMMALAQHPFILLFAELGLVIGISAGINRLSFATAGLLFVLFSVVNGLTMSFIFLVYAKSSIATTFFITAGTFLAMALVGTFIKRDLSTMGRILFMALIGLVIASVVNMFMHSSSLELICSYAGVLIFTGLTAWDAQKIKQMLLMASANGVTDQTQKIALLGSLSLYLDFINMFLYLLRFFGSSRD